MITNEIVRILAERWRIVVVCLLVGVLGAAAAVTLTPPEYAADIPLYVSVAGPANSTQDAYHASQLAKDRMASYAALMRDQRITQGVIDKLQLPMTPQQLAKHLTVAVAPDATVMTTTITDSSPQRAAAMAQAAAEEFVGLAAELEQPVGPADTRQPTTPPKQLRPRIIRQALASPIPVWPNVPLGLGLGAALGLLIGVAVAFISHARDTTLKDPRRLHDLTEVPVLASIPFAPQPESTPTDGELPSDSERSEAHRRLRTALRFHHDNRRQAGAQVIVITSPNLGDGTSATACSLALALTASNRVILIDANLGHPQVASYLGLEPGPGLTTVLAGELDWATVRRRVTGTTLEVIPSGPLAPRWAEPLASPRLDGLLRDLRGHYDFVVIDAPALLPVADAATLAARADGVILITRYGVTTEEDLNSALETLHTVSAPLLGTALNMTPPPRPHRARMPTRPFPRSSPSPPTRNRSAHPRLTGADLDTAPDHPEGRTGINPNGARSRGGPDEADSANR